MTVAEAQTEPMTGPARKAPLASWVAIAFSTSVVATALFACSGSSRSGTTARTTATPTTLPDVAPTAADFVNINTMTHVGDRFVGSLNGHRAEAVAVARSATGGVFPVGTVIQLVPLEAMVKRSKGYSAATRDWEFFSLAPSAQGTRILKRGTTNIDNPAGSCASCHSAAPPRFDFVCTKSHGCPGLTLPDSVIATLQHDDPRPSR
jgi:hypothetical protein